MSLTACLESKAQVHDISFSSGMNVPMYKGIENDITFCLDYGQYWRNGLGFRAGIQWTPSVANIDNIVGIPLSFVWYAQSLKARNRLYSGAVGVSEALKYGWSNDDYNTARTIAGSFLMNLFSDMGFFAGLTPGYVNGSSSNVSKAYWGDSWQYWEEKWTEKKRDYFLTLDAGMSINYCIWRFDIKLIPAFHYNITGNYLYHSTSGRTGIDITSNKDTPLRWFFSLSGGLSFRF